jgi:hypothetical protein
MKYLIENKQVEVLGKHIQSLINASLESLKEESEEWGLGEMSEYEEVQSIYKIEIDRIVSNINIKVYIDIYTFRGDIEDYENVRAELQYRLGEWIPNVELYINDIIV